MPGAANRDLTQSVHGATHVLKWWWFYTVQDTVLKVLVSDIMLLVVIKWDVTEFALKMRSGRGPRYR